jgi:hypothetical protein
MRPCTTARVATVWPKAVRAWGAFSSRTRLRSASSPAWISFRIAEDSSLSVRRRAPRPSLREPGRYPIRGGELLSSDLGTIA